MPKYIDSKSEVRIPKQSVTPKKYTDPEITKILRELQWGVSKDERVNRNLETELDQLYVFDDRGKLVPAIGEEENLSQWGPRARLIERARNGELFVRALGESGLRQVTVDDKDDIRLSKQIGVDAHPQVTVPAKPKRPFFVKFWLPFLFREEIDAYNTRKAEYDEAVRQDKWIRNFADPENKAILQNAAESEKERLDYPNRFAAKQARLEQDLQEEIELEQQKNASRLQAQMVISNSMQAAQSIRQQQKDQEVSSTMCKGLLALGHPNMAIGTGYESYEKLLKDLDSGGSIISDIQNGAGTLELQGWSDATIVLNAMATVLKLNNQYIDRYTPDKAQFHAIARVNETIFGLLEGTYANRKGKLEQFGIRQEDMDLARGVVEVDRAYRKGLEDKARGLENLARSKPVGGEHVAGAMTGESIYAMAVANSTQGEVKTFYTKLGEIKRNTPVSKAGETYDKMRSALWNTLNFQKFMGTMKDMDAMELLRTPARLRAEYQRLSPTAMGKQLGMPEKTVTKEIIQQQSPAKSSISPSGK